MCSWDGGHHWSGGWGDAAVVETQEASSPAFCLQRQTGGEDAPADAVGGPILARASGRRPTRRDSSRWISHEATGLATGPATGPAG